MVIPLELMRTFPSSIMLTWQKIWASPGWFGSRFAKGKTPTQFSSTVNADDGQSEKKYIEFSVLCFVAWALL